MHCTSYHCSPRCGEEAVVPSARPPARGRPRPRALRARGRALGGLGALVAVAALLLGACGKDRKALEQQALAAVDRLLPLVERDTKQVRDGLPVGAKKIAPLLDADAGGDLAALQRAIGKARASVDGLAFAKSTFFVFVDPQGVVLRSEADPDLAAGQSLFASVPETKRLADSGAQLVETFGKMPGFRGVQNGADMQWIVGHPVTDDASKLKGAFVTGWSLRNYASYLEEDTRRELVKSAGDTPKAIPLVYLFVVRGNEAFGAPITPDVNAEAVGKLDLVPKAKAGPYTTTIDLEGRSFAVGAKACPALGPEVVLALLYSEV
jgi:hypothetical protein